MIYFLFGLSFFLIFLIGGCFGGFLGVITSRIYKKEKLSGIFFGRSYCHSCNHILSLFDTFPLLSYFYLKGRCKYCNSRLSKFHVFIELSVALDFLFIFSFVTFDFNMNFLKNGFFNLSYLNSTYIFYGILAFIAIMIFHFFSYMFLLKKGFFRL